MAFSPDGRTVAAGGVDSVVTVWNTADRREVAALTGHRYNVTGVVFSPDGGTLASCDDADPAVKLWDVTDHRQVGTLTEGVVGLTAVRFSPDGRTLAASGLDKTVKLWKVDQGAGPT